jgi:hypothetical protein
MQRGRVKFRLAVPAGRQRYAAAGIAGYVLKQFRGLHRRQQQSVHIVDRGAIPFAVMDFTHCATSW